ncbi:replication initiation protein [Campylobacter concisus]|jgi:plasmid replication initiation protein|uniref:replication initiation protein n=1 Tax=Campylobacter concisus TaxID=199 RepID=UPI0018845335|nr:replication initiation protein [Campylobacter concisus]MBE9870638.1 replication initiation protein [Campylobacter concisus]
MNEVVKYSNELHELKFNSLNEAQQNVFFTLLQQFRKASGDTLELDFNKLFELAQISQGTNYRKEILDKLGRLQEFKFRYQINELGDLRQDVIFPSIETDSKNKVLRIRVSQGFKDRYISSPIKGWTRYELAEFVGLSGTYTKTIYRYLKQFKSSGRWRIRYDDFKELLGVPEKYRASEIDKWILKPAIKELSAERNLFDMRRTPFEKLVVIKHKKGREIEALEFCFMPQPVSELEKDEKENERNLATIARDIQREERLRSLKQNKIDELKAYLFQSVRVKNPNTQEYDTLKIIELNYYQDKIKAKLKNSDDDYITEMTFESIKHLQNFLGF